MECQRFVFEATTKRTGLYMLMGISTLKLEGVFAMRGYLLVVILIIGLFVGILFSKLFFMLLGKAMMMSQEIPFSILGQSIVQLVLCLWNYLLNFRNQKFQNHKKKPN
ncbi:hypothetical protein AB9M62_24510 [Bacillales bacterium AN1005]